MRLLVEVHKGAHKGMMKYTSLDTKITKWTEQFVSGDLEIRDISGHTYYKCSQDTLKEWFITLFDKHTVKAINNQSTNWGSESDDSESDSE